MHIRILLLLILIQPLCLVIGETDRVDWLRSEIARHDQLYWEALKPEITDEAYDALVNEYSQLTGELPPPWSGTAEPGERRPHRYPMLSLNKLHSKADWQRFKQQTHRLADVRDIYYRLEPKYDGVAISLVYRDGYFQYGLTRGDGEEGIVVSTAVQLTAGPPAYLPEASRIPYLEIRGELYADTAQVEAINEQRLEAGDDPYAQARHLVAATLRIQDVHVVAKRSLSFVAFDLRIDDSMPEPGTQSETVDKLANWGFAVPTPVWENLPADAVYEGVQAFGKLRGQLNFPTDGLVIKVECRAAQSTLGSTQRAPRWAAAWKYPGPQVASRILEITESVGETGRITPIARIEPIEIEGIRIENISLHSRAHQQRMGYSPGQRVSVHLAGGVIPAIVEVIED
ncbi:MAG: hypothetical protein JJU20_13705 [Opitutales bacterium]|nr:hypothetical protein [Opitutales bacterium]